MSYLGLFVKVWSQLHQPGRLHSSDITHVVFGRLYYLTEDHPGEERRRGQVRPRVGQCHCKKCTFIAPPAVFNLFLFLVLKAPKHKVPFGESWTLVQDSPTFLKLSTSRVLGTSSRVLRTTKSYMFDTDFPKNIIKKKTDAAPSSSGTTSRGHSSYHRHYT